MLSESRSSTLFPTCSTSEEQLVASIRQMGEDALVSLLTSRLPLNEALFVGPGDDCAVVQRDGLWDTLLKTDAVVEGIHFTPETPSELIGRKALARAVSDVAAMGGLPEHALVTILAHPERPVEQLEGIYRGLGALAEEFGIAVAGGETAALPTDGLALSITLTGRVEHGRAWLRSTASPGDLIAVTGKLGASFPSGRHLTFRPRLSLARLLQERGPCPTAAMDLSDGLGTDLPRLARASGCGFRLDESLLPRHEGASIRQALTDGEDYELLLCFHPGDLPLLAALFSTNEPSEKELVADFAPLTVVGSMTADATPELPSGWQHFAR